MRAWRPCYKVTHIMTGTFLRNVFIMICDRNAWVHNYPPDTEHNGFKVWSTGDGWYYALNDGQVNWRDDYYTLEWMMANV